MENKYPKNSFVISLVVGFSSIFLSLIFGSNRTVNDNTIENDPILPMSTFETPGIFDAIGFFSIPVIFLLAAFGFLTQKSSSKLNEISIIMSATIVGICAMFGISMQGMHHFADGSAWEVFTTTVIQYVRTPTNYLYMTLLLVVTNSIAGLFGYALHKTYRRINSK